jgi:hypothetical protein
LITTYENLFLPEKGEKLADRKITILLSDGTAVRPRLISPSRNHPSLSRYIYVYKIDIESTPVPLSADAPRDNEILTGLGLNPVLLPVSGRVEGDLTGDIFMWPVSTKHGSNGSPIFNSSGKVIAVQLWRKEGEPVKCLRLPVEWLSSVVLAPTRAAVGRPEKKRKPQTAN